MASEAVGEVADEAQPRSQMLMDARSRKMSEVSSKREEIKVASEVK